MEQFSNGDDAFKWVEEQSENSDKSLEQIFYSLAERYRLSEDATNAIALDLGCHCPYALSGCLHADEFEGE